MDGIDSMQISVMHGEFDMRDGYRDIGACMCSMLHLFTMQLQLGD